MRHSSTCRPLRRLLVPAALVAALLPLGPRGVEAQVPRRLPFQGRLLEPDGSNRPDGSHLVTFRLKTVPGGALRWTESRSVLSLDGTFHALLGSGSSLPAFDEPLCLTVEPPGGPESDCVELGSQPWALLADDVLPGGAERESLEDGAVTSVDLAPNSVDSSKIDDASVTFRDLNADELVLPMSCSSPPPPETVYFSPTGDETFFCSLTTTLPRRMAALLKVRLLVEQGCSQLGPPAEPAVWTRLTVNHDWGSGPTVVEQAYVSSQVDYSDPDAPTAAERDAGHGSLSLTVPVRLRAGFNGLSFTAIVDGQNCEPKQSNVWAKWSDGSGTLVLLGGTP